MYWVSIEDLLVLILAERREYQGFSTHSFNVLLILITQRIRSIHPLF